MADTIIAGTAEVAGPRGARAFEWVNGGVRVKEATSLVGGEGIAKETNIKDTEEAGKVGGQRLEVRAWSCRKLEVAPKWVVRARRWSWKSGPS